MEGAEAKGRGFLQDLQPRHSERRLGPVVSARLYDTFNKGRRAAVGGAAGGAGGAAGGE